MLVVFSRLVEDRLLFGAEASHIYYTSKTTRCVMMKGARKYLIKFIDAICRGLSQAWTQEPDGSYDEIPGCNCFLRASNLDRATREFVLCYEMALVMQMTKLTSGPSNNFLE